MANFSPQKILSSKLSSAIETHFRRLFDGRESALRQTVLESTDFAMSALARADTQYHNSEHTFIVSLAGLDILQGKAELGDPIDAEDWATYIISLLFHDIGYLKKLFPEDSASVVVANAEGGIFPLGPGATDASLTRIHVDRGMAFVREHFKNSRTIDVGRVIHNIENTRFPPPPEVRDTPAQPPLLAGHGARGGLDRTARGPELPAKTACPLRRVSRVWNRRRHGP